jgi:hypothetical protein
MHNNIIIIPIGMPLKSMLLVFQSNHIGSNRFRIILPNQCLSMYQFIRPMLMFILLTSFLYLTYILYHSFGKMSRCNIAQRFGIKNAETIQNNQKPPGAHVLGRFFVQIAQIGKSPRLFARASKGDFVFCAV